MPAAAPWLTVLKDVKAGVCAGRVDPALLAGPAPAAVGGAAARAHSRLLIALDGRAGASEQLVSELVGAAAELLVAVAELRGPGRSGEQERAGLTDQLSRGLNGHEESVLAGELTYEIWAEEGAGPAARIRQAIAGASSAEAISLSATVSVRTSAVEMAALLVRAAANLTISQKANGAPQRRPVGLDRQLQTIEDELVATADAMKRPLAGHADAVAHHLAAGLRVPVAIETMDELERASVAGEADPALRENARSGWLRLATLEYIAVTTLADQLEAPAHDKRLGSLSAAIQAAAAHVLCDARLTGRPHVFRHHRAWRAQMTALSYALEVYVAGIRGHAPSLAQAQLIVLTRLARAVAAIVTLDLCRSPAALDESHPA
ncbi:MAG: hypothetical protein ACYCXW_08780 [Solirubrobacteraceae bacterium]